MFEKNDRALLTVRKILIVIICIFAVLSLAEGIILTINYKNGAYFFLTFAGWFLCWLVWIFARLYLSYLCDIKLIRNKLYGEDNDALDVFLKSKGYKSRGRRESWEGTEKE